MCLVKAIIMDAFAFTWDCVVEKREEQDNENAKHEVGIPELSLLLENNTDQTDCPISSAISEYETSGSGHGKRLFHFLLHLLDKKSDNNNAIIRWENRSEGLFRIYSLITLATLWGREKNNYSMDHNKLRRALRYYIDKGKLLKVDRHLYKFTTDFKENKYIKSSSSHQSSFEYPCKYTETINSEENSPLSFIDENTHSGDICNPPAVLVGSESNNFDVYYNHNEISKTIASKTCESWFYDKRNCPYENFVNVNSTNNNLYSSNIDIPCTDNFNSPVSDNSNSLSPNDSLLSDCLDFSLRIKHSNSEVCLPELLPSKRFCPETAINAMFEDIDFSYSPHKATDLNNDDTCEQHIVPDTGLHSYTDLSPDMRYFDYSKENESCDSNLKTLISDLHKDLQFLNNA